MNWIEANDWSLYGVVNRSRESDKPLIVIILSAFDDFRQMQRFLCGEKYDKNGSGASFYPCDLAACCELRAFICLARWHATSEKRQGCLGYGEGLSGEDLNTRACLSEWPMALAAGEGCHGCGA